ncbi:hypothetical protein Afil01_29100 [Actinorhabdospora filicis]|uniref:Ricin B lectin domain-containing protein n=1 Tax=Actinorhabdospora filicis TaxID=1785913 RepID=A0A9W6SLC2_9ACTN|nr:RICIN domain-containing protein [Actinorhabdospora filicis]GLZ78103.1 hypothetical protein Afil01_29100 [Actinorhabdospora filicis]
MRSRPRLLAAAMSVVAAVGLMVFQAAPAEAAPTVVTPTTVAQAPTGRAEGVAPPKVTTKDCTPTDATGEYAVCFDGGLPAVDGASVVEATEAPAEVPEVVPAAAPVVATPVPNPVHLNMPWCDGRIFSGYSRYESCLKYSTPFRAIVVRIPSGQQVGTASWAFEQRIRTYRLDGYVTQSLRVVPVQIDSSVGEITLNFAPKCTGACTAAVPQQWGSFTWTSGDFHPAEMIQSWNWTGRNVDGARDLLNLTQKMSFVSSIAGTVSTEADYDDAMTQVRCDRQYSRTEGCVFHKYTPTFTVDANAYPAGAYFIDAAQMAMGGQGTRSGRDGLPHPLHREADESTQDANRRKICQNASAGFRTSEDTLAATLAQDPTDKVECDEYPFAGTEESGTGINGKKAATGLECDQFHAYAAVRFPGKWSLGLDWDSYADPWPRPGPGPEAPCGRASMPKSQNGGVGRALPVFYGEQRILDGDPFFVDASGNRGAKPGLALPGPELRIHAPGSLQCLGIAQGGTAPGDRASTWACNKNADQQWNPVRVSSGVYEFRNRTTALCLTGGADGVAVTQEACTGAPGQRWQTTANRFATWGPYTAFEVKNTASGKCLGTEFGVMEAGARVLQRDCADTSDQNWF